jgi:hypothetical protein
MSTFAVTNSGEVIDGLNYVLSNLNLGNVSGNITVPNGTLVANATTGEITQYNSGGTVYGYVNQYVNLRYATNSTGTAGFSTVPTNATYFGVFNSATPTPSSNPAAYVWREVAGGFGLTKTIYYSAIGGRQVLWAAASSPPSSNYVISTANVAIDLDVVTTAAGLPGERGPIAMAYVVTTADPNSATSAQLTSWFEAARDAVSPPIGTGLTPPVAGDTATFIYGAGVGTPSGTFSYNGSVWNLVVGQVIDGNVIVANTLPGNTIVPESITGDRIANVTITGNLYALGSISGDRISTNTIEGNNIAAATITGNKIAANTITGDRITANTITGNRIQVGTLTGNLIAANTITGNLIVANTITGNLIAANTIQANSIVANSITATQISSAYIYAGNIVSFGASLGNNSSTGYWLQYNTGNARFGGNVSIGNSLTIGANASIGGNLAVSGLISSGNLVSNTVATLTIQPSAVSTAIGLTTTSNAIVNSGQPALSWTSLTGNVDVLLVTTPQSVVVAGGGELNASYTGTSSINTFQFQIRLRRQELSGGPITTLVTLESPTNSLVGSGTKYYESIIPLPSFVDTAIGYPVPGPTIYYRYWFECAWNGTSVSFVTIRSNYNSISAQGFKR